jgi:hypothetical protein
MIIIAIIAYNVSFQVVCIITVLQFLYCQYIGKSLIASISANLQTFDIGKIFDIEV